MIDRQTFFERFPHFIALPEKPQCIYCWQVTDGYTLKELGVHQELTMTERHTDDCPLADRNGVEVVVASRTFKDGKVVVS